MTASERIQYRISVLQKLAEAVDYNQDKDFGQTQKIIDLYGIKTDEEYKLLLGTLEYLDSRGYVKLKTISMRMGKSIFSVSITAHGIDFVESLELKDTGKIESRYGSDFPLTIVNQYINQVNSPNSPIIAASQNVNVTIEQTIEEINNLPESSLSEADKQAIAAYLQDVEKESVKSSRWEKVKKALGWLIDKSADAFVAAVPYLLEKLK